MLNYMGSIVGGVMESSQVILYIDVTNIDILKLCEIHIDLICLIKYGQL